MPQKTRKKTVNKTLISKVLSESQFDPRQGGPLKAILDEFKDNPTYLENRAIELIREAQLSVSWPTIYAEKSQKVICLLAMARAIRETM